MNKIERVAITRRNLEKYAGVRKFRFGEAESEDLVGVTTGLAWTEVGGELLTIEAGTVPGKGRGTATGKTGAVIKQSVPPPPNSSTSPPSASPTKPPVFPNK